MMPRLFDCKEKSVYIHSVPQKHKDTTNQAVHGTSPHSDKICNGRRHGKQLI
jgi:hypothetical protein